MRRNCGVVDRDVRRGGGKPCAQIAVACRHVCRRRNRREDSAQVEGRRVLGSVLRQREVPAGARADSDYSCAEREGAATWRGVRSAGRGPAGRTESTGSLVTMPAWGLNSFGFTHFQNLLPQILSNQILPKSRRTVSKQSASNPAESHTFRMRFHNSFGITHFQKRGEGDTA